MEKNVFSFVPGDTEEILKKGYIFRRTIFAFVDISGFSSLSDILEKHGKEGSEKLKKIVDQYLSEIICFVIKKGGILLKFSGDGLLFRFPYITSNMKKYTYRVFKELITNHGHKLIKVWGKSFAIDISIGLNIGKYYDFIAGNDTRKERFITGEVPSDTIKAEMYAGPGEIISTYNFIKEGDFIVENVERFYKIKDVKGNISEPGVIKYSPPASDSITSFLLPREVLKIENEHRDVVVIFLNVRGLKKKQKVYDKYFNTIFSIVKKYGGFINKVEPYIKGDRIMIVFGIPVKHEDFLSMALLASLEIKKYGEENNINQRIGINYGRVFAGILGADTRKEFTVIGDTVNKTDRLLRLSRLSQIVSSHRIFEYTNRDFLYRIKKSKKFNLPTFPDRAYVLHKKKTGKRVYYVKLIGRDRELQKIYTLVKNVMGKRMKKYLHLTGEAGTGKTRMLEEMADFAESFKIFKVKSFFFTKNIPLLPFREGLKQFLNLSDTYNRKEYKNKLLNYVKDENSVDIVLKMMGWEKAKPEEKLKEKFFYVMLDLFDTIVEDSPIMMAIDDIQWLDDISLELIEFIYSYLKKGSFLLVTTERKENGVNPVVKSDVETISLNNLNREDSKMMITSIIPGIDDEILRKIVDFSEGNPLFIEELCRFIEEIGKGKFPSRIKSVILERVDALSDVEKHILKDSSLIGREFNIGVLQKIENLHKLEIEKALLSLESYGFIYSEDAAYSFKHDVVRETVYDIIPFEEKRKKHFLIGEWYESRYSNSEEYYEIIAYHYLNARNFKKSEKFLRKTINKLLNKHLVKEAKYNYDRLIEILPELYRGKVLEEKKFLILENIIYDLVPSIKKEDARSYLKRIKLISNKLRNNFKNRAKLVDSFYLIYGEQNYKKAFNILTLVENNIREPEFRIRLYNIFAEYFHRIGNLKKSIEYGEKAIDIMSKQKKKEPIITIINNLVLYYIKAGEFEKAERMMEQSRKKRIDILTKITLLSNEATLLYHRGDLEGAYRKFMESAKLAKSCGDMGRWMKTTGNAGTMLILLKRYKEAIEVLKETLSFALRFGHKRTVGYHYANIASLYGMIGLMDKSEEFYMKSLQIRKELGERRGEATVLYNLAFLYNIKGNYKKAINLMAKSIKIYTKIEDLKSVVMSQTLLIIFYLEVGDFKKFKKTLRHILFYIRKNKNEIPSSLYSSVAYYCYLKKYYIPAYRLSAKSLRNSKKNRREANLLYIHYLILKRLNRKRYAKKYLSRIKQIVREDIKNIPPQYRKGYFNSYYNYNKIMRETM